MSLQYGIKEVLNCQFMDFTTGAPTFYVDYATASTNEVAGDRLFLTAGQGNYRLMAFDHSKTSTLKLSVPLVDLNMLALLTGDSLTTAAQTIFYREILTITAGAATLSQTPAGTTIPSIYFLTGSRDNGAALTKVASAPAAGQFAITGTALTFNATDNGKQVAVWYQYTTPSSTQKISLKANKFTKPVKIVGQGLAIDQVTEASVATNILFYKAKVQPNFTLTMSSTDYTKLELTFDLFAVQQSNGDYAYADYVFLT